MFAGSNIMINDEEKSTDDEVTIGGGSEINSLKRESIFSHNGSFLESVASTQEVDSETIPAELVGMNHHLEKIFDLLLEQKEEKICSIMSEMSQVRMPFIRKTSSRLDDHDDLANIINLERNNSSSLFREEMMMSLNSNCTSSSSQYELKSSYQKINLSSPLPTSAAISSFPLNLEDIILGSNDLNIGRERALLLRPPPLHLNNSIKVTSESLSKSSCMIDKRSSPLLSITKSILSAYPLLSLPFISGSELKIVTLLGRGQFATVDLCLWKGVRVALKEWHNLTDDDSMSMALQEARTLAALRHPCVLSFYGMLTDRPSPGLVVEYMPHRSLKDKLWQMRSDKKYNTKKLKLLVALQTARGMEFLHSRNVIHFDLKCDNLLCDLRDLENPVIKIGDVGLSKQKLQSFVSGNMRGTLPWMAPELFPSMQGSRTTIADVLTNNVNEKVDVYSYGVVMWEIWTMGDIPYPNLDAADLLCRLINGTLKLDDIEGCDQDWSDLMNICLQKSSEKRPSFEGIVGYLEKSLKNLIYNDPM